jgi:hypothetical protein
LCMCVEEVMGGDGQRLTSLEFKTELDT